MNILITGNMGYVGPVLVKHLKSVRDSDRIMGFDSGLFAHCLTTRNGLPERRLDVQFFADLRDLPTASLDGVEAVVHLAAVSNDPIGNRYEAATRDINFDGSAAFARAAKAAGVSRFVFASSCSIYGAGSNTPCAEDAPVNPLTAYARSKVDLEATLSELANPDFRVTCLRFATACGMSERLRLDLVLNDFVASAITTGEVSVLSDGTPWRPLIHVRDMARAIDWAMRRDDEDSFVAANCGFDDWNFQVSELAEAVARCIPGTKVSFNENPMPDKRSYRVDFSAFARMTSGLRPCMSLNETVTDLCRGLNEIGFADPDFRASYLMRLNAINDMESRGLIDGSFRWRGA